MIITLVNKSDLRAYGMRYVIFRIVFYAESESGLHFAPKHQVFEIFVIKFFFWKITNHEIKYCKIVYVPPARELVFTLQFRVA